MNEQGERKVSHYLYLRDAAAPVYEGETDDEALARAGREIPAFRERLAGGFHRLYHLPIRPVLIHGHKADLCPICQRKAAVSKAAQESRLESLQNKTILVFTPHPDDDVFGAGGTIALLNRKHNKVYIVVYTNDDKGSYDPEMTSQRLARIRRAEPASG